VIYPVVDIQMPGRSDVILDEQQERLVAEPIRQEPVVISKSAKKAEQSHRQEQLFETLKAEDESPTELQPEGERISQNVAIRLVRGFSGSGKTLVLMQRARYLAAQYPSWKIGVFTYNKPLQEQLEQFFKGTPSIKPRTFHSLCSRWVQTPPNQEAKLEDWVNTHFMLYPVLQKLGGSQSVREMDWIRDMGLITREDYLRVERKGIGRDIKLTAEDRNAIFDVLEEYRKYLQENNLWDWPEIPLLALENYDKAELKPDLYDAVLVDEAQDWAPVWFKVLKQHIHPEHGAIFLADDPSQSIYRYFSWKDKGVHVVGRTRWLKVPYRNTYEIYRAAYSMIADHEEIQKSLSEEGELIEPEISSQTMRHGPRPLVRKFHNAAEELGYLKNTVASLRQPGFAEKQIAVLVRYRRDFDAVNNILRGSGVSAYMMHSFKGLEMEVILIPSLHTTFARLEEEGSERRLLYMAMSRARAKLYMTYSGKLPQPFELLRKQDLADFVE
jgi:superfamily I DNA/RNA helicase